MLKRLTSSKDIVDAVYSRQTLANKLRVDSGWLFPIMFWIGELPNNNLKFSRSQRKVKDLTSFYNLRNNDKLELVSSIFSDKTDFLIKVDSIAEKMNSVRFKNLEDIIREHDVSVDRLMVKIDNIERFLKTKNILNSSEVDISIDMIVEIPIPPTVVTKPEFCTESM
jgi:hypothetical protein